MAKLSDLPLTIKKLLERDEILEEAAKEIKKSIPIRTRIGKGVKENLGPTHQLPKLNETTVRIRKQLKKSGKLTGPAATPGKSGFNRTGDTLNNLTTKVSNKQISVTLDKPDQKKLNDAIKINPDYQFMRLSAAEFKRVLKAINEKINQTLSKVKITDL